MGAAGGDLDLPPRRLANRAGPGTAAPVDQVFANAVISGAELHAGRKSDTGRKARRSDMGTSRGDLLNGGLARSHGVQSQRDV